MSGIDGLRPYIYTVTINIKDYNSRGLKEGKILS